MRLLLLLLYLVGERNMEVEVVLEEMQTTTIVTTTIVAMTVVEMEVVVERLTSVAVHAHVLVSVNTMEMMGTETAAVEMVVGENTVVASKDTTTKAIQIITVAIMVTITTCTTSITSITSITSNIITNSNITNNVTNTNVSRIRIRTDVKVIGTAHSAMLTIMHPKLPVTNAESQNHASFTAKAKATAKVKATARVVGTIAWQALVLKLPMCLYVQGIGIA